MRTIPSILLPIALFLFCAECAHGKPRKPDVKDGPSSVTKTVEKKPNGGVNGYLKVDYADTSSSTHTTTWQYRLHSPQGLWSPAQPLAVGTSAVQLAGSTYYDVKFNPPGSETVNPNPYTNVLVTADTLTTLKLKYTPKR